MHEAPCGLVVADAGEERAQLGRLDRTERQRVDPHAAAPEAYAQVRESCRTPALATEYAICELAAPITARNDAVLMIDPPGGALSNRCGTTCLQQRNVVVRLAARTGLLAWADSRSVLQ
jgi:hypothetical protein